VIATFREAITDKNKEEEVGRLHVVLVDGQSSRTRKHQERLQRQQEKAAQGREKGGDGTTKHYTTNQYTLTNEDDFVPELTGRTDTNKRCVWPEKRVFASGRSPAVEEGIARWHEEWGARAQQIQQMKQQAAWPLLSWQFGEGRGGPGHGLPGLGQEGVEGVELQPGDYAIVHVHKAGAQTLYAEPLARTTIAEAAALGLL
jgi:hypothetical protein